MKKTEIIKQFIRFGMIGVFNTAHYYGWYLLFLHVIGLSYLPSHITAFILSMIGSFYLNSYFTYRTKPTLKKFFQFPLTYVVNIAFSSIALVVFVDVFGWDENVSPIIAQGLTIPVSFFMSKLILEQESDVT